MKLFFLGALMLPLFFISQVGINTTVPKGVLHIDGARDNPSKGEPSSSETDNDFIVTKNGDVGIGTISPQAKIDIQSKVSGVLFPRMNTTERDVIPTGRAQAGTMIYNTDVSKIQLNQGTDLNRVWVNLDTASSTINTSIALQGDAASPQTIRYDDGYVAINFPNVIFNNVPGGFVTKVDDNTVRLAGGKIYKVDVNMGRMESSDLANTWCSVFRNSSSLASISILPNGNTSRWNSFNTMQTYISVPEGQNREIQVKCSKTNSGQVKIPYALAPIWSITIMN